MNIYGSFCSWPITPANRGGGNNEEKPVGTVAVALLHTLATPTSTQFSSTPYRSEDSHSSRALTHRTDMKSSFLRSQNLTDSSAAH
uniref:Uncharacterized protein n=1 Tax=Vespula pensylvanica TaxID=30213 RepID=A0A834NWU1_VESPE|nr:hypothetical protein H0235_010310 [Vespula pensylvanica]